MTPPKFTFDLGQVKIRSKGQIFESIFLHKKSMLDSEFLQDFKYVISFLLRFVELPNVGSKKHAFLLYIAMKTLKKDILKKHVHIHNAVL